MRGTGGTGGALEPKHQGTVGPCNRGPRDLLGPGTDEPGICWALELDGLEIVAFLSLFFSDMRQRYCDIFANVWQLANGGQQFAIFSQIEDDIYNFFKLHMFPLVLKTFVQYVILLFIRLQNVFFSVASLIFVAIIVVLNPETWYFWLHNFYFLSKLKLSSFCSNSSM